MDRLKNFCKRKGRDSAEETERRIKANDAEYNATFHYSSNYISTSKYNFITFLPKNLFEQFRRLANAYFLFLLILQLIPQISSLPPITTILPLVTVLAISAIKDAADDVQRHRSDSQVNNRKSLVLRDGKLVEAKWQTVVVGDIIKMEDDQFVAADLLLLSSSEPNGLCYIETAELDGETNLKVRQSLKETSVMADDIQKLASFDGEVACERPNNVLNKFEGTLRLNDGQTLSLDNDKVLLRGCVLRNTSWCFGLVLFAGKDTKLMMNSGKTKFKRTHIDRLMNVLIIGIFIFLVGMCLVCCIGSGIWESLTGYQFTIFLPWETHVPSQQGNGAAVIATLQFFSYIIVLNTVVPISLYVSVEMIRFGHSWWINWDNKMYHAKTNTPAKSRTTTLNEELGQIEYIFSDKTGTLTQNVMTFNKCSVNGQIYGDVVNESGQAVDITESTPKLDFSWNAHHEPKFEFYDKRLLDAARQSNVDVQVFFRLLAICHTVMSSTKDGRLEYQAQSPDEAALVSAARNFGFVFKTRTPDSVTIEVLGIEEVYELLCILDFDNVRKRMSVIVRRDDKITLYCKGADTTIYQRLDPSCSELQATTTVHLESFAQDGLRTLCCAAKDIDTNYFNEWKSKHHTASISLVNRDEQLAAVYEEIEQDLMLVGATAIEDKLQDGVPEAIANLSLAGIKLWVLTGDKQETAINIGYSCHLLSDDMADIHVVDADSYDGVENQLTEIKRKIQQKERRTSHLHASTSSNLNAAGAASTRATSQYSNGNSSPGKMDPGQRTKPDSYAIVLNGHSLEFALQPEMEMLLLETSCQCQSVICCRVTPLQKARVVELVKKHCKTITLAIGDGANDVSMIKTAHIGIGISGHEGMQAVLASDYSLAQFCYLERLLLVHGRWSYIRMCKFMQYFFYKNFAFTLCHLWFAFFCGFSAQTLYDQSFITLYNIVYTSLPVLALGFLDQDVSDAYSLRYPKLYTPGHLDEFFNKKVFARSATEGIISSLVLFFIPFASFSDAIESSGVDAAGLQAFGTVVASILIVVVSLRCGLETSYWTGFNHFFIWGSIVCYFAFTMFMYSSEIPIHYMYEGVAVNIWSTANFWFTMILCVAILLLPVVAERFYFIDTRPTLSDKVRLKQKVSKLKTRAGERIIRRSSTMRRSRRSLNRSGYAFAHQQGFGELITSGSMMTQQQRHQQKATPMTAAEYAATTATRRESVARLSTVASSASIEELTCVSRL